MSRNQKTGAKTVLTIFICTSKISPAFCRGRDASRQEVVAVFAVAPCLPGPKTGRVYTDTVARGDWPALNFSGPSGSFSATVHINHQKGAGKMPWEIPKTVLGPPMMPKGDPCPALPICGMVGNARKGCSSPFGMSPQVCIAGLILLTARGQNLYTEDMESELQKRRTMGFIQPSSDAEKD